MDDPRFPQAIELFNAEEFFACHDVLEEIWSETLDEDRNFYQGLIHAAVALFHFTEGNLGGARKMCSSAMAYLSGYAGVHRQIDLDRFRSEFDDCFAELRQVQGGYPHGLTINERLIPKIHLIDESDS